MLGLVMLFGVASGQTPTAAFDATPVSGTAPLTVTFTDQSTGNPTGWAWYFGDESYSQAWTQTTASAAGWSGTALLSSVAMADGSIVLTGGNYHSAQVWRSTDYGATWTDVNCSPGWSENYGHKTGRFGHASVALPDGSIVLMGGDYFTSDVWRSTNYGATWTEVNSSAGWPGRGYHSTVVMADGSIVLMGGQGGESTGPIGARNDVWRSEDNGATWTQMTASADWRARFGHSSVAMPDGSIVLMGGSNDTRYHDVWRSRDNGTTWTEMTASAGWSARVFHTSVALPDGSIVLMGGYDGTWYNDTWRSTDNGATWNQINASAGWTARYGHSSVVMPDGSIVLIGGAGDYPFMDKNDTWRFMPAGSSAKNPSHTYTKPGIYQVSLQAYNADGYNSTRKSGYITVGASSAPVASITTAPRSVTTMLTVTTGVVVTIIAILLVRHRWIRK